MYFKMACLVAELFDSLLFGWLVIILLHFAYLRKLKKRILKIKKISNHSLKE